MKQYLIFLIITLASACSQSKKVEFPFDENELLPPTIIKATPTIHLVSDSILKIQYDLKDGILVERDSNRLLQTPKIIPIEKLKKTTTKFQKYNLLDSLSIAQYIWDEKTGKLIQRKQNTPLVKPKTVPIGFTTGVPSKAKIVIAKPPQSNPFLQPVMKDLDKHGILTYSLEEGLPGATINDLAQDKLGRIWVTTDNGVAVMEGNQVKFYTTEQGLSSNLTSVLAIEEDRIWIGTFNGLNLLENGKFTHYTTENGLSNNNIRSILVQDNKLWVGTDAGLNLFENNQFYHYSIGNGLLHNSINSLVTNQGKLWIGTDAGLSMLEDKKITHYTTQQGLSNQKITSLALQGDKLWIGTENGGVNVLENNQFKHYTTEEGLPDNFVQTILAKKGELWVGTENGGLTLLKNNQLTYYNQSNGLSSNNIISLLETDELFWIGGDNGLSLFKDGRFKHYTDDDGIEKSIRSLLKEENKLWFGTYGTGLHVLEDNQITQYITQQDFSQKKIWSITKQGDKFWVGTGGGLHLLKDKQFIQYTTQQGLSNNTIISLASEDDKLWIGTGGGGLNCLENDQFIQYTTENSPLLHNYISSLVKDGDKLWIGTFGGGLSCLENGRFTNYTQGNGLKNNEVLSLLVEGNKVWIGTWAGVSYLENGQFKHYSVENGLADNAVIQLAVDSLNQIWAGTARGLTRFSPKKEGSYSLKTWRKNHGLKSMAFNGLGNPMLFDVKENILWASAGSALTAISPTLEDKTTPKLFLTGVDVMQKQVNWFKTSDFKGLSDTLYTTKNDTLLSNNFPLDSSWLQQAGITWKGVNNQMPYWLPQNLVLPYDQNHLTFHYSGLKPEEQGDIVYRYILEGLDKEWSPFTKEGKAEYRNIPPGNYQFKVRARGQNQIWSEELSFRFQITSPWWQTWWAYLLYILFVLLAIYGFVYWRTQRLRARQVKLEWLVDERTADLAQRTDDLKKANKLLQSQKEEMTVQNEELRQTQDELISHRDYIEISNRELNLKNTKINQSIKVAESIQQAFLPSEKEFQQCFSDYFIFNKPKDIVSGDFYWLSQEGDTMWVAVADCTGHGVPGAFMTMLGKNLLDRLINIRKIETPAAVLDQLDKAVVRSLRQKESKNNSGMDIILIKITKTDAINIQYAGAKNALYVMREDANLQTYKADRVSIGGIKRKSIQFTNQSFEVKKGTSLFLSSDGLEDQNDVKRRSFGRKRVQTLFKEIADGSSFSDKQELLETTLIQQMAGTEQRDDILVVGLKI